MVHQKFKSTQILTGKVVGFRGAQAGGGGSVIMLVALQTLRRFSTLTVTELDITFGITADISADLNNEYFLSVVDQDNLPEVAALRVDNAWQAAERWQVSTGAFTIPTQVLQRADPRFFYPKSWANLEAQPRRLTLAILNFNAGVVGCLVQGTIRFTEVILQRTFGNDNAYSGVNPAGFDDDHGMAYTF